MVQAWAEPDVEQLPVDIVARDVLPEGYLHVFDEVGPDDEPVSLIHEDTVPLRLMAVFDVLINNGDRKGGHVLAMAQGNRYGADHGVAFNVEKTLRSVMAGGRAQVWNARARKDNKPSSG